MKPVQRSVPASPFARALALQQAGDLVGAAAAYRALLESEKRHQGALNNLGQILLDAGKAPEAEPLFRRALASGPDDAGIHVNLARALALLRRLPEALGELERALDLAPGHPGALNNLAGLAKDQARYYESVAIHRRLMEAAADDARTGSNYLLSLHYGTALDPADLFAAHRAWAARHAAGPAAAAPAHANDRSPERRLRVGYLSPDFRFHPVAYFTGGILAAHDRGGFEVFCYSAARVRDEMTDTLRKLSHAWREAGFVDDAALARQVREDHIDILVDLAGHTAGNRLTAMALRPAPVQFTYLGYPDTTGLDAIGYRLTDAVADPPGESDTRATERLLRLDGGFLAYRAPSNAPDVAPLPASAAGAVTFGSLNNLAKLSDESVALWARVLRAVPGARLLLKSKMLDDAGTRALVAGRFAALGIDPGRLELLGASRLSVEQLATYHRIDVALDPTPYNGTTTTCEALWMGVPVVTLAGDRHSARVGASILAHAGLGHLVASEERGYVRIAASLAADLAALARLRAGLRETVARSPLTDTVRLARAIEAAYRQAWRRWCEHGDGA